MTTAERDRATRLPVRKEYISPLVPEGYARADIARMLDEADPAPLLEAAAGWGAAAGLLASLHDDLRARAEVLAGDWDGAAAAACQSALRRIAGTARQLSRYAEDLQAALSAAAQAQERAKRQLADLRAHPAPPGGIDGARLLEGAAEPGLAGRRDVAARQWMQALHDGYRSAMAALPDEVAFDLPGLVVPDSSGHAGADHLRSGHQGPATVGRRASDRNRRTAGRT